ncbi:integrase, catalytic region, zinc finger, CCHC-type containing protein [Tanacetum coccineum]
MLCKPKPYYDEQNKVAIGYKNPLCLTRVKQVQPALYNGHEIIKTNHVPAIVHNSEDTLEIAEITRKKMNDKMKDPKCVKKKVKIAPHDYSKENYLATFTPQKQLTPEQIFWSKDLIKMKAEALKEQTTASRPIKALTMYPPNTPVTLVPRVLPTKSQVKINIFALIQLFSEFEKTCKKRITPMGLTEGEMGFEQTKECYLTEVIPFFKTLNNHFEGIQKALTKEIKEMKEIFDELEAEVDQNVVNRKHDEIERKNLQIYNDNLIADCLSKHMFYIATNSELNISRFTEMNEAHTVIQVRCLKLEAELSKLRDTVQKEDHTELVKCFSNLEIMHAEHIEQTTALLTKNQNLKAQIHENLKCITIDSVKPRVLALGSVETVREIVEEAKVERPLDRSLASACLYTKHSQELLEYAIGTCPKDFNQQDKKHAYTHLNKKKRVTFEDQCETSNNNTHKHIEKQNIQKTSVHVLPPTGVNSCTNVVQIVLWYLDSGCSKHMMGNRSRLRNFMKKFTGTVRFGNDHFGAIMGYKDYVIADSVISRVYYVEGLGHNLFFVRQFCDSDLEVAFRKHSYYVRDTDGVELFKGSRGSNVYTISVEDMMKSSPICLLSKASKNKSWLWHRRLNHLNFGTINDLARKDLVRDLPRLKFENDHLCSACQLGKSKKHTHKPKTKNTNLDVLNTLHMDLCGPMRVQTINGKKYILVIVDDYSRTPQQNGVVERRNHTLVEAARTMLIFSKALMFLWAEAVATACYIQNRSLIHTRHNKTPYELVHDKNPDLTFFRVFGAVCYPTNDSEDLGKLQPIADIGIFVGYAPSRKGYRIYNKRTRKIMETIHVQFDELSEPMAPVQLSTGPTPMFLMPGQISSGLVPNLVPAAPYVPPTNKELEILFQLMFDEYLEPPHVKRLVSPALAVSVPVHSSGTPSSTTIDQDAPSPSHLPSSLALQSPSLHQGVATESTIMEDNPFAPADNDPFINVFAPEPSSATLSSGDLSSTDSPYVTQTLHHLRKWSKDHPLDNIIGNPSRLVSTRKQLATDALWCLYNSVLSKVEPKNFKSTIIEDCWFQAM